MIVALKFQLMPAFQYPFANLLRITEITWSILSTLTFKDN